MVRVLLIDEPGADSALNGVLKKITGNRGGHPAVVQRVRMLHDGMGRINGDTVFDLRSGLELASRAYEREALESVDFIGHGAPGVLLLGGSSAGGPRTTSHSVREWAQLDTDIDKLPALVPFAKYLRELRNNGRLAENFEVRVLGCNTAADPGITPASSLGLLQDGPVLIHFLSSFFDVPVSGVIGYIGPENFDDGCFEQKEIHVRCCAASPANGTISFVPDRFPPGMPILPEEGFILAGVGDIKGGEAPVLEFEKRSQVIHKSALAPLFEVFEPVARPLPTRLPLVIRDASIHFRSGDRETVLDIVEHGKALVVRAGDKTYRAAPSPEHREEAQAVIARFLEQETARRPLWAGDL